MMVNPFDILTTYVAYVEDSGSGKYRTVLVIRSFDNGRIVHTLNITHHYHSKSPRIQAQYFPLIKHWRKYGLKEPSFIDIKSRATILTVAFRTKKIGRLPPSTVIKLLKFIKNYNEKYN